MQYGIGEGKTAQLHALEIRMVLVRYHLVWKTVLQDSVILTVTFSSFICATIPKTVAVHSNLYGMGAL
jgi:hypothetical protein